MLFPSYFIMAKWMLWLVRFYAISWLCSSESTSFSRSFIYDEFLVKRDRHFNWLKCPWIVFLNYCRNLSQIDHSKACDYSSFFGKGLPNYLILNKGIYYSWWRLFFLYLIWDIKSGKNLMMFVSKTFVSEVIKALVPKQYGGRVE